MGEKNTYKIFGSRNENGIWRLRNNHKFPISQNKQLPTVLFTDVTKH